MITLNQIMTDNEKALISVFNSNYIKKKEKELQKFNQKTKNFLESIKNIKIDL